jgi:hypothetical protein
MDRQS